jgi:hypothetical protein
MSFRNFTFIRLQVKLLNGEGLFVASVTFQLPEDEKKTYLKPPIGSLLVPVANFKTLLRC